jgi:hypothetical protein
MASIDSLLREIDEQTIAKNVGIPHDEARMRYALAKNTVSDFNEFTGLIADYYNHHVGKCVIHGGLLPRTEAAGRAKEIIEQEYRRHGGSVNSAYNDAHDGTNGGLRIVLDRIAERLKTESVERYVRDVFDRYIDPTSWENKVDIMRQFLSRYGDMLSSSIRRDQPERYAQNYEELIRAYVEALRRTTTIFGRF